MIMKILIIVILLLYILIKYNELVKLRNKVNRSKSGIDVYLTHIIRKIYN